MHLVRSQQDLLTTLGGGGIAAGFDLTLPEVSVLVRHHDHVTELFLQSDQTKSHTNQGCYFSDPISAPLSNLAPQINSPGPSAMPT